jgi:hypothetical protein
VAVLSDVLTIARGARSAARARAIQTTRVSSDRATPYYVRFTVADRPGIIAALASVFAKHDINIDAILQEPGFPADHRPFIVSLDAAPSEAVGAALSEIAAFDFHIEPMLAMPVLDSSSAQGSGQPDVSRHPPVHGRLPRRISAGRGCCTAAPGAASCSRLSRSRCASRPPTRRSGSGCSTIGTSAPPGRTARVCGARRNGSLHRFATKRGVDG